MNNLKLLDIIEALQNIKDIDECKVTQIGHNLYKIGDNCICNENILKEINKRIVEDAKCCKYAILTLPDNGDIECQRGLIDHYFNDEYNISYDVDSSG